MRVSGKVLAIFGALGWALVACSDDSNRGGGEAGDSGSGGSSGGGAGMGSAGMGSSAGSGTGGRSGGTGGRNASGTGGRNGGGMAGMNANGMSGARASGGASGGAGRNSGNAGTGMSMGGSAAGSGGAAGHAMTGDSGWLYTQGNKVYVTGNDAEPWIGRGVNIDDIMFCGYNGTLWMQSPGDTYKQMISTLITNWKPTFLRASLGMASFNNVSWLNNPGPYKTPMLDALKSIGQHPGVYVLITLRSDQSMIARANNSEATCMPSDAQSTPDKNMFPTGTDAVYKQLVDDFQNDAFVLFGLSNEPGGNTQSDTKLKAAMAHAVSVIRAEEDKLGTPHHVIAVQGNSWTSNIAFYDSAPIDSDNIVYEVHGYPPPTESYTFTNLPVIIGEYGGLSGSGSAFFNDLESKAIPSLAWDYQPFSNCSPDLVNVTTSATDIQPTDSGKIVRDYLVGHAK